MDAFNSKNKLEQVKGYISYLLFSFSPLPLVLMNVVWSQKKVLSRLKEELPEKIANSSNFEKSYKV